MKEYIIEINKLFKQFQSSGSAYESFIGQATSSLGADMSSLFLKDIPAILAKIFPSSDYKIKPSIGQGRLTQCPWIAIMDKRETDTTQRGVYIVFLLSRDLKCIYLTLAQGVTQSKIKDIEFNRELIKNFLQNGSLCLNIDHELSIDNESYKKSIIYSGEWVCDNVDHCKRLLEEIKGVYEEYIEGKDQIKLLNGIDYDLPLKTNTYTQKLFLETKNISDDMKKYIYAIKTKPFVLLAGISGTGKSRIVRQLARACDNLDENPWKVQKPKNFEMIQVKPNWHDSSELLGYVSRIDGEKYVVGDFLKFIVRAWENLDTPYFLCLDEMNLAPVEQYFAEYLSVIESRRLNEETGEIETDPIVKKEETQWYQNLVNALLSKSEKKEVLSKQFMEKGITIPQNLIVMGTVNMDETTFSFSRKVLDRAMTIEMNEVKLDGGLTEEDLQKEQFTIGAEDIIPQVVEGKDVYGGNKDLCDKVIAYLQKVNDVLEGTPFKIAYRTRNEFLIYAVNRGVEKYESAIDEMTSMKILSRIEGDAAKLLNVKGESVLDGLHKLLIEAGLNVETSLSLQKINEMQKRLNTGYTSYWS